MIRSYYLAPDGTLARDLDRAAMKAAMESRKGTLWVDFEDPSPVELEVLGPATFNFHPLVIEDCIHAQQHPKVDDFEEYLFLVFHAWNQTEEGVRLEELDTALGRNYLMTYHVEPRNSIRALFDRIDADPKVVLGHGPDFLLHEIIDRMVDNYNHVVDGIDERVDLLEERILAKRSDVDVLREILRLKKDLQQLFRTIRHQRDVIHSLSREGHAHVGKKAREYFRNVYDHVVRVHDVVEGLRDEIGGLRDAYLSAVSNRMNEVVKGLTFVSTIILPMALITGVYGMNFDWMPFLKDPDGFWFSVAMMGAVAAAMLLWFRRRGWA